MTTIVDEPVARVRKSGTCVLDVPASASNLVLVRAWARETLREREITDGLADDVTLLVSELVANAVLNAGEMPSGGVRVEITVRGEIVRVETQGVMAVGESDREWSEEECDAFGYRLRIVNALTSTWGDEPRGEMMHRVRAEVRI
jgi:anti-sigma regulatory factor (Ser/Thr protein kinase)